MNSYRFAAVFPLLALVACNSSSNQLTYIDGQVRTDTPEILTTSPVNELNARVTLGGQETIYYARDYPNGDWVINANLAENREHNISVNWYSAEHLLMEQSGSFYVDSNNPTIMLDLDFVTSGPDRFDDDCDQISNLDEIKAGTHPGTAMSPCNEPIAIPDPAETKGVWISHKYERFADFTDNVSSVVQKVQLRKTDPRQPTYYGINVRSEGDIPLADGSIITADAHLQIVNKPTEPNLARFFVNHALSATAADGAFCNGEGPNFFCTVPFNSSTKRWYELQFNKITDSQWQGLIVDIETGVSTVVASFEMPPQTKWTVSSIGSGYRDRITAAQCSQALSKSTLRYTDALLNDNFSIPSGRVMESDCLKIGVSWTGDAYSKGTSTSNGEFVHTLSIGR